MTLAKIIKLMLIRIGDEKRDQIDAHVSVLKTKFVELMDKNDSEMIADVLCLLQQVIENMPHKVVIYAQLIGLIAMTHASKAYEIVAHVLNKTVQDQLFDN